MGLIAGFWADPETLEFDLVIGGLFSLSPADFLVLPEEGFSETGVRALVGIEDAIFPPLPPRSLRRRADAVDIWGLFLQFALIRVFVFLLQGFGVIVVIKKWGR